MKPTRWWEKTGGCNNVLLKRLYIYKTRFLTAELADGLPLSEIFKFWFKLQKWATTITIYLKYLKTWT